MPPGDRSRNGPSVPDLVTLVECTNAADAAPITDADPMSLNVVVSRVSFWTSITDGSRQSEADGNLSLKFFRRTISEKRFKPPLPDSVGGRGCQLGIATDGAELFDRAILAH